eukprot:CAMPEP_0204532942 /NCGR_PEP_ID=MMETSP0661-20131031/12004_1 /ASSEMBLY_ACC=CAM_ASM_000606 /TAXON_ID=109239 /ORGANISM="Alexandrium margalefi, Strain AMGDE01CS-322" /LENGTH=167 /DNA_ID=CAMNT_0051539233 /DNA_START=133 /DNA_END=636 /DNA_ORIENTATION=-
MPGPADSVTLPDVEVNLPDQSELKLHTACCCVHCGIWLPEDKMKLISATSKVGCLCMSGASNCFFEMHKTLHSEVGKAYCCDLEKDYKGEDGWLYQQNMGKGWFCLNGASKFACAKTPFVLLKGARQCLCCDTRCAIPMDEEVPMQIAVCGRTLYAPGQKAMVQEVK